MNDEVRSSRIRPRLLLLLLLACHAVGLLLFCKGFLLRRVVVPQYSNCSHVISEPDGAHQEQFEESKSCYPHPRRFKRVVWLLIDALRYDFLLYDPSLDPSPPVFRNKLPYVRHLLETRPQNARIYQFVADPPTTTMQRLKALTTGSLPTFIDIGANFNSHRIDEDSLPWQTHKHGRNVTFMGDDTWLGLYEGLLTRVFDYPSLNVKDLHTVDNGVIQHMIPELERHDAEFVVGHFLGVDHVGHTYGSTHWTMGEKLSQMNGVLQSIFSAVDEDTIVFVFGDHGMTVSGDHGGETEMETTAGLLVFTPSPLFPPHQQSSERTVYQIDIVSTVSLLLGIPIPFSNLGMLIPEVFLPWDPASSSSSSSSSSDGYSARVTFELLDLLQVNAQQIQTYLKTYVKLSDDFPSNVYIKLQDKFSSAQQLHANLKTNQRPSQEDMTEVAGRYVEYMRDVKAMCHNVWAKFDNFAINQGTLLFFMTVLSTLLSIFNLNHSLNCMVRNLRLSLLLGVAVALFTFLLSPLPLEIGLAGILDVILSLSFYPLLLFTAVHSLSLCVAMFRGLMTVGCSVCEHLSRLLTCVSFTEVFATIATISCSVSLMSNSFILYEGDMTVFLLQTMLICLLLQKLQSNTKEYAPLISNSSTGSSFNDNIKNGTKEESSFASFVVMFLKSSWPILLAMVIIRVGKVFYACRDLQVSCEALSFILPYHGAVEELGWIANLRLTLSCLGTTCVPVSLAVWVWKMRFRGGLSLAMTVCVFGGLPLASLCVGGFWLVQSLPQPTLDSLPHWQHVILPRIVYIISLSTITISIIAPFKKTKNHHQGKEPRSTNDSEFESSSNVEIEEEGSTLQSNDGREFDDPVTIRHRISNIREMNNEPQFDLSTRNGGGGGGGGGQVVHQLESIHFAMVVLLVALWIPVAMVLNDGVALSAILMVTQMSLLTFSLHHTQDSTWPMVVLWGLATAQFFFASGHHATVTSLRFDAGFVGLRGEMSGVSLLLAGLLVGLNMLGTHVLLGLGLLPLIPHSLSTNNTKKTPVQKTLLTISLQYLLFHSFKTLVTLLSASLQRRHLMVWGVFSPRFLYEAAFLGATHVSVIFGHLIISYLHSRSSSSTIIRN